MRHQAWLAATPEGSKKSRAEIYKGSALADVTPEPEGEWLVADAIDCGVFVNNAVGLSVVPWSEVYAWAKARGISNKWLLGAVRNLSRAYVAQYVSSADPGEAPPMRSESNAEHRAAVAEQLLKRVKKR